MGGGMGSQTSLQACSTMPFSNIGPHFCFTSRLPPSCAGVCASLTWSRFHTSTLFLCRRVRFHYPLPGPQPVAPKHVPGKRSVGQDGG